MERLTHIASDGSAKMVDVSAKPLSHREAVAAGRIELQATTLDLINRIALQKATSSPPRAWPESRLRSRPRSSFHSATRSG